MKRDMNLVREILLTIEAESSGFAPGGIRVEGYTDEQIGYHTLVLVEAGLVIGQEVFTFDNGGPSAIATRLTWAGHEF